MSQSKATHKLGDWRRHALFGTSLVLMCAGLLISGGSGTELARGICLKVGIVLFMIWLALPQLLKLNYWAVIPVGCVSLVAVVRPQLIPPLVRVVITLAPVLFLIWVLRPKAKN